MILLYTGAVAPNTVQTLPSQSLGGFVSSSLVPNGSIGNLFNVVSDVSLFDLRMIVLKNTLPVDVTNLKIYTVTPPESTSQLKIAAVEPGYDAKCDRYYFELLSNPHTLPYQAVLDYQEGVANAIEIPLLEQGKMIGIWLDREKSMITTTTTLNQFLPNTVFGNGCTEQGIIDLENRMKNPTQQFNILLKIEYT